MNSITVVLELDIIKLHLVSLRPTRRSAAPWVNWCLRWAMRPWRMLVWLGWLPNHTFNLCAYILDAFTSFFTPRISCSAGHCLQVRFVLRGATFAPSKWAGCSDDQNKRTCHYCFHYNSPSLIRRIARFQKSQELHEYDDKRRKGLRNYWALLLNFRSGTGRSVDQADEVSEAVHSGC